MRDWSDETSRFPPAIPCTADLRGVAAVNNPEHSATGSPPPYSSQEAPPDISSTHVREDVAKAGRCANVHLPTGRTCILPKRHRGSCDFLEPEDAENATVN